MRRPIQTLTLPGQAPYAEAYDRMMARRAAVERGQADNALFLLSHRSVVTLGRDWRQEHLQLSRDEFARRGIDVVETDRGGGVTWHGPGQLVAYPVLNLRQWRCSVGWYLRALEQAVIDTLAAYGVAGERLAGFTGVWTGGAKVAAVGIGVRNWVTFHGAAINVDPDMGHFGYIVPCGIADKQVTSLRMLLGSAPSLPEVRGHFEAAFRRVFDYADA